MNIFKIGIAAVVILLIFGCRSKKQPEKIDEKPTPALMKGPVWEEDNWGR